MRYVISESRLNEFIINFLNTFVESNVISNLDSFIVISSVSNDELWEDYMEYDYQDERLWINRDFLRYISDLFASDENYLKEIIKVWFSEKFFVDIGYIIS